MRYLDLSKNYLSDCSPLKYLVNLEYIDICQYEDIKGKLYDIKFVKKMKNLMYFSAIGNSIVDVSPLKKLKQLRTLYLNCNLL